MGPKVKRSISYVKKQFQYRKPIFPFISSTFQDFQVERDILVKKVFPRINALCHERGTYCAPVDLRWGINDSQTNSGLIIQLCLDYIDRCAPFFICLLGERYGSHRPLDHEPLPAHYDDLCPSCHWLDRNLVIASSAGYDWVLDEKYQHCSITELEVIHAAFDRRNEYCRFYFRQPDHLDNLYTDLPEEERAEKLRVFEPESEYSNGKLCELKAQIAKHGLPIKYFKSPNELAVMVLQDWSDIVDQLYPPLQDFVLDTYSERFTEWMAHETFAETRRRIFVRTPEIDKVFHQLTKFALTSLNEDKTMPPEPLDALSHMASHLCITRNRLPNRSPPCPSYKSVLLLTGDRGCGKTSVLANWVQEFSSRDDLKVFAHYVGSSALSFDIMCFMRRCTVEMRDKGPQLQRAESDVPDTDELADFHRVREAFVAAISLGPCVIVIDGVDELTGTYSLSQQQVKDFQWLPSVLPPQCKIIITLATCNTAFKSLSQRGSTVQVDVPPLLKTCWKTEVIQEHLAIHCKCLSEEQLKRIVKCRLSDKPLFLSILANELQVFGVYSRLDYHLDSYLESTSIRELWTRVIRRWIKDYGCPTDAVTLTSTTCSAPESLTGWVADALRLIAVSRHGLSQVEILQILNTQLGYKDVTSFEWALFQSAAMDSLFARPGGLLKFFHQHFKDAVEYSLLGCVSDIMSRQQRAAPPTPCEMALHKQLAKFFYDQPHSSRRTEELPWHLQRSGELTKLCSLLSDTKVFLYMYGADKFYMNSKRLDLIHYWKGLLQANYNAGATYKEMIQTVRGKVATSTEMEDDGEDPLPRSLALELPSGDAGVFSGTDKKDDFQEFFVSEPDQARALVKRHDSIQNSLIDFNDCSQVELASLANKVGQFLSVMEHFREAEEVLLEAHHTLYESIPLNTEGQKMMGALQESTATLFYYQLKTRQAMDWYKKALSSVDSLLEEMPDDPDKRLLLERKGRILDHLGDMKTHDKGYEEAEIMLTKALRCMEKSNSNIGKATVLYHIGYLRHERRKFAEAEKYYYKSLTILERWFGKRHPKIADVLNHLAGLLGHPWSGPSYAPQKAEELYRRALSIRQHVYGSDHIMVATTLYHLGKLLMTKSGELARREASDVLKHALDIRTMKLGYNHNLTRAIKVTLAKFEKTRPSTAIPQEGSYARTSYQFGLLEQDLLQTPPATYRTLKQTWVQPQSSSLLRNTLRRQGAMEEALEMEHPLEGTSRDVLTPLVLTPHVLTPHVSLDVVTTNVVTSHVVTQASVTQNAVTKDVVTQNVDTPDFVTQDVDTPDVVTQDVDTPDVVTKNVDTHDGVIAEKYQFENVGDDKERTSSDTVPGGQVIFTVDDTHDTDDTVCHTEVDGNMDTRSDDVKCQGENINDDSHSDAVKHCSVSVTINNDVVIIGDDQDQADISAGQTQSGDTVNGKTHPSKRDINGNDTLSHDIQLCVGPNLVTSHLCIDSFIGTKLPNNIKVKQGQILQVGEQRRSKSATPLDLFNRYGRKRFKTRSRQSARSGSRSVPASSQTLTPSSHFRRCHIPDQFAHAPQNGYSAVHGPHSSLDSLGGKPDAPRNVSRDLVHKCTWYHVPGRYPTMHKPYVPKRLLRRMRLKKWQAVFDDYMLSNPDRCLSADTDSEGTEMSDGQLITYFNNP